MDENSKYRNEHYPRLMPCMKCDYWRGHNAGGKSSQSYPMCHYILDHGEPRPCVPDYLNETCEAFKPRTNIRKKPVFIKG